MRFGSSWRGGSARRGVPLARRPRGGRRGVVSKSDASTGRSANERRRRASRMVLMSALRVVDGALVRRAGACGEPARLSASAQSDADLEAVLAALERSRRRRARSSRGASPRASRRRRRARRPRWPSRRSGSATSACFSARVARVERVARWPACGSRRARASSARTTLSCVEVVGVAGRRDERAGVAQEALGGVDVAELEQRPRRSRAACRRGRPGRRSARAPRARASGRRARAARRRGAQYAWPMLVSVLAIWKRPPIERSIWIDSSASAIASS